MAEEQRRSKHEIVKESSNFLRGTIADELARDTPKFGSDDVGLLKFHGTYQQDDRDARKHREGGADKAGRSYIFMIRTKVPGGKLTAEQFLTELSLAERLGNGTLRITTRQGFQLHGVVKGNVWATIHEINESLLTTLAACGDVERNVMCCPAPHHNDGIHDRLQATADDIARHLAPQTRAYFEIWVDKEVEEYLGGCTLAEPHPVDIHGYDDHLGWHPQGDDKFYLGVNVENGRIKDDGILRLKSGLRHLFERFRMSARLTPQQSLLLCDLQPEWQDEILALLREHGIQMHEQISIARRFAMACPALPTCGLAITESERVMPSLVDELEVELAKLGLDAEQFTIRMTGCPNGCARPYTSDIGLVGKAVGKYTILVGGRLLGNRLNSIYKDMVPLREVVKELRPLLVYYKTDREPAESLGDFCHRKGVPELVRFDAEYKNRGEPEVAHA